MWDLLLCGGEVIDGTGAPRFRADIGVLDGKIEAVGTLGAGEAKNRIDAAGRVVCPGFIDMHSHSDLLVLQDPRLSPKVQQGITTDLIAQDGLGVAPVSAWSRSYMRQRVAGLDGSFPLEWDWGTVADYLGRIARQGTAINIATLVGHGTVRAAVIGAEDRPATPDELRAMARVVAEAMEQGAFGISTGLIYPPCTYATREELVELCRATRRYGGFLVVHVRSETDRLLEAFDEVLQVTAEADIPLHVSHLKAAGQRNWTKLGSLLEAIDQARASGRDVTFDQYPYIAGSTMLDAVIPPWYHEGGVDRLLGRLASPAQRAAIKQDIASPSRPWENWAAAVGWNNISIAGVASPQNKWVEGKRLTEIADAQATDPAETAMDLILAEKAAVSMIIYWGKEEQVPRALCHPAQMVGTDGLVGGMAHPRLYGTYPRILGRYVREQKVLSLEEAIARMTGRPARRLGLKDRGFVKEGMAADLVVFDPATVTDMNSFRDPHLLPVGIDAVVVNGTVAVQNGDHSGRYAGTILRRGIP